MVSIHAVGWWPDHGPAPEFWGVRAGSWTLLLPGLAPDMPLFACSLAWLLGSLHGGSADVTPLTLENLPVFRQHLSKHLNNTAWLQLQMPSLLLQTQLRLDWTCIVQGWGGRLSPDYLVSISSGAIQVERTSAFLQIRKLSSRRLCQGNSLNCRVWFQTVAWLIWCRILLFYRMCYLPPYSNFMLGSGFLRAERQHKEVWKNTDESLVLNADFSTHLLYDRDKPLFITRPYFVHL